MAFIVSLAFPFFLSIYSVFVLHKVWEKPEWATYVKWLITFVMIVGGIFLIIGADKSARWAARQPAMQSFVEDANLTGRI
jgi:hypothetical protein